MTSDDNRPTGLSGQLTLALDRSCELEALIDGAWVGLGDSDDARVVAPAGLCAMALDHGRGLRALLADVPPSAIALLRPQYESLVRAVWARHAATDSELERLLAPLTMESQQAAKSLPGVPAMLASIENSGPRGAGALLARARSRLWDGLNSFVHGGIHPFRRGQDGYPVLLLIDVLKNANVMSMLTLLVLAEIVQDEDVLNLVAGLHEQFEVVLPALEPLTG